MEILIFVALTLIIFSIATRIRKNKFGCISLVISIFLSLQLTIYTSNNLLKNESTSPHTLDSDKTQNPIKNTPNYNKLNNNQKTQKKSYKSVYEKLNEKEIVRVGAICMDGTKSYATGRGACSHHGGVDYWLYGYE